MKYAKTFIVSNNIEWPLFKPPTVLESGDLNQWVFDAHALVKASGVANCKHCRIRVPSELNIENWRELCGNYCDQKLKNYLEYGFSLYLDRSRFQFNEHCTNHPSAVNFPSDIEAIVGPCDDIPFKVHYSPLLSKHKDNDTRRIIVNLSFPYGASVNDCIPDNIYDGDVYTLKYPTVDNIVEAIHAMDSGVLLSKIDVSRVFRNLRVDPHDYEVLGLTWNGA